MTLPSLKLKPGKSSTVQLTGPFIVPRRFDIPQLAQYLSISNFRAEELLRNGEIRFKWDGSRKRKIVEKADADAWADKQPYAEATIMERTHEKTSYFGDVDHHYIKARFTGHTKAGGKLIIRFR